VREPKLIRIGEMLPGDEIDMSVEAALLEADFARRLLDAAKAPKTEAGDGTLPPAVIPISSEPGMKQEPPRTPATPSTPEPSSPKPTDSVTRISLKATVGKTGFFDLNRALSWLRDNATEVHVAITVDADAGEPGFDRVKFRNGVMEPLEEGGATIEVELG
jgi:hypothetical protein